MCGRFSLTKEEAEIEQRFNAKFYSNDLMKRYNVAPGQLALVLTNEQPGELQLYKWGLVPFWAKEASIGSKMINARAETVFEKPSFKKLVKKRRCLVIGDGFYEWKPLSGKHKQPYRIGLKEDKLFAFAGLWDVWSDKQTGGVLHSFTIITTDSNSLVSPIHDRMPVILHRTDEAAWLDFQTPEKVVAEMLRPFPAREMQAYPVSELVNSPKNDSEEVILPVETGSG